MRKVLGIILAFILVQTACRKEDKKEDIFPKPNGKDVVYNPTPYHLQLPSHFDFLIGQPYIPEDNPLTEEGVALGKKLFFEVRLSKNNLLSCASCHEPAEAFNDMGVDFSLGVNGQRGIRNAMPLFNLGWVKLQGSAFNWIGSAESLEEQAFGPVTDHLEMDEKWVNVEQKLQEDALYPPLFYETFGTEEIDSTLVVKAIAQYIRTLISAESRFDNFVKLNLFRDAEGPILNEQEIRGFQLFMAEGKGDCFHCHGDLSNPLLTDNKFKNNGLDLNPDSGLAEVTGNPNDVGKFRTPSLRNLIFTSPYMHDGRFETLREVVDFYTSTVQESSPNIDAVMFKPRDLSESEKDDLIAFLEAVTDSNFVNNPVHRK